MPLTTDAVDAELREMIARGEIDRATDRAVRIYGPELVAWLRKTSASEADAYDAFSTMCERLWKSLARYEGRCSVRVWCYMLARQSAAALGQRPERRHEQLVSGVSSIAPIASHIWSTSRRAEARADDIYEDIRRSLDEEDQTLLILRVDRDMPWREIAIVLLGDEVSDDEIERKAAALRKQFERVKARLRLLAAEKLA